MQTQPRQIDPWPSVLAAYLAQKEAEMAVPRDCEPLLEAAFAATAPSFSRMIETPAPDAGAVASKLSAALAEYGDHVPRREAEFAIRDLERIDGSA